MLLKEKQHEPLCPEKHVQSQNNEVLTTFIHCVLLSPFGNINIAWFFKKNHYIIDIIFLEVKIVIEKNHLK